MAKILVTGISGTGSEQAERAFHRLSGSRGDGRGDRRGGVDHGLQLAERQVATDQAQQDRSFFRPLTDLEPGDARVFLGVVLPIDGTAGLRRRVATASRYISDFGVAMYCGFGRQPGRDGTETMREHARVVREVRRR